MTTDIVFLQKARAGETPKRDWINVGAVIDSATSELIPLNEYFCRNPQMMLGAMKRSKAMYGAQQGVLEARAGEVFSEALAKAITYLPQKCYTPNIAPENLQASVKPPIQIPTDTKVDAHFIDPESQRIARRLPDELGVQQYEWAEGTPRELARIHGMIELRLTLRKLMSAERNEMSTDAQIELSRRLLNQQYDQFLAAFGHVNSLSNKSALKGDPEYSIIASLERDYDKGISLATAKKNGISPKAPYAEKAAIFNKRILKPVREITHCDNAQDALVVTMNELGVIDFERMVSLTGKTVENLEQELLGLIYTNPISKKWESAEQYLGGNVKKKLNEAVEAAQWNGQYHYNIEALRKVQPADLEPEDISVQLGAIWLPNETVAAFAKHLLGQPIHVNVSYQATIGKWFCKIDGVDQTTNHVTWGTERVEATELFEGLLSNRQIQIRDKVGEVDGKPIYKVNIEQTAAAQQKAEEIKQKFADWVWDDAERRKTLSAIYNERFNTNIPTIYNGQHLKLHGVSDAIEFRPHQKNGVWRAIQDGGVLFDHEVGAGKTFVCVATAMESKRMGLLQKPMFVVPNHLLMQWQDAFYTLYPEANILIAGKDDFAKEKRQKLFSQIATGDWDAVVVAHSSFKRIAMPEKELSEFLHEQIKDLTDAIYAIKAKKGDRMTIKQMEKAKARMEAKIKNRAETGKKDNAVNFDELGVDALFVDESHEFKNLYFTTELTRVAGLGNQEGSEKAMDMFIKARSIQKKNDGRGVYFATGTPISNTIAEVYTVQRYMQYDEMKRKGIHHFDAWASTFGKINSSWELDATGINYKLNSRFSQFQNVPELIGMYRSFADVITKHDLEFQAQELGKRFPIPKIKGGKPKVVVVERSEAQARYQGIQEDVFDDEGKQVFNEDGSPAKAWNQGSIVHRMENLPKNPSIDNPLKITNDARLSALDYRIIDEHAADFAGSKINRVVKDSFETWENWKEQRGTQLIFCDLSTPKGMNKQVEPNVVDDNKDEPDAEDQSASVFSMDELLAAKSNFSVYDDIKQKLVAKGIPAHEIRFIHEANTDLQKQKLFDQVNRGEVRILLGTTQKMGAG